MKTFLLTKEEALNLRPPFPSWFHRNFMTRAWVKYSLAHLTWIRIILSGEAVAIWIAGVELQEGRDFERIETGWIVNDWNLYIPFEKYHETN